MRMAHLPRVGLKHKPQGICRPDGEHGPHPGRSRRQHVDTPRSHQRGVHTGDAEVRAGEVGRERQGSPAGTLQPDVEAAGGAVGRGVSRGSGGIEVEVMGGTVEHGADDEPGAAPWGVDTGGQTQGCVTGP